MQWLWEKSIQRNADALLSLQPDQTYNSKQGDQLQFSLLTVPSGHFQHLSRRNIKCCVCWHYSWQQRNYVQGSLKFWDRVQRNSWPVRLPGGCWRWQNIPTPTQLNWNTSMYSKELFWQLPFPGDWHILKNFNLCYLKHFMMQVSRTLLKNAGSKHLY